MRQESEASLGRDVAKSFQNLCGEESVGHRAAQGSSGKSGSWFSRGKEQHEQAREGKLCALAGKLRPGQLQPGDPREWLLRKERAGSQGFRKMSLKKIKIKK